VEHNEKVARDRHDLPYLQPIPDSDVALLLVSRTNGNIYPVIAPVNWRDIEDIRVPVGVRIEREGLLSLITRDRHRSVSSSHLENGVELGVFPQFSNVRGRNFVVVDEDLAQRWREKEPLVRAPTSLRRRMSVQKTEPGERRDVIAPELKPVPNSEVSLVLFEAEDNTTELAFVPRLWKTQKYCAVAKAGRMDLGKDYPPVLARRTIPTRVSTNTVSRGVELGTFSQVFLNTRRFVVITPELEASWHAAEKKILQGRTDEQLWHRILFPVPDSEMALLFVKRKDQPPRLVVASPQWREKPMRYGSPAKWVERTGLSSLLASERKGFRWTDTDLNRVVEIGTFPQVRGDYNHKFIEITPEVLERIEAARTKFGDEPLCTADGIESPLTL
jgi:hypothetical protein